MTDETGENRCYARCPTCGALCAYTDMHRLLYPPTRLAHIGPSLLHKCEACGGEWVPEPPGPVRGWPYA